MATLYLSEVGFVFFHTRSHFKFHQGGVWETLRVWGAFCAFPVTPACKSGVCDRSGTSYDFKEQNKALSVPGPQPLQLE